MAAPAPAHTGPLGATGYHAPIFWSSRYSVLVAAAVAALTDADWPDVVPNPHLAHWWADETVRSPQLLAEVRERIGPDVAVENTFLMAKWPGRTFPVPLHQDGINDQLELDPNRAVSAWLAFTAAPAEAGCLQVVAGSHTGGYLPYEREPAGDGRQRRATTVCGASGYGDDLFTPVPLDGGQGVLFDVRLLHRSAPNTTDRPRIGLNIRFVAPQAFRRGTPAERPGFLSLSGASWA